MIHVFGIPFNFGDDYRFHQSPENPRALLPFRFKWRKSKIHSRVTSLKNRETQGRVAWDFWINPRVRDFVAVIFSQLEAPKEYIKELLVLILLEVQTQLWLIFVLLNPD